MNFRKSRERREIDAHGNVLQRKKLSKIRQLLKKRAKMARIFITRPVQVIARQCLKIGSMWETSIYRSQDLCFKGQNNQPAHLLLKISFVQAKLTRIAAKRNLRLCIAISQNGSPKTKINLPSSNLNNSPITKKSQATPYQARKPSLSKPVAHQSPKLMKSTKAWVKTTRILVLST